MTPVVAFSRDGDPNDIDGSRGGAPSVLLLQPPPLLQLDEVILPGQDDGHNQPFRIGNHRSRNTNNHHHQNNNNPLQPQSRILARFTQPQRRRPPGQRQRQRLQPPVVQGDSVWPVDRVVLVHPSRSTSNFSTRGGFEFDTEAQRLDQLVANLAVLPPAVDEIRYPPSLVQQQQQQQRRRVNFDLTQPKHRRTTLQQQPILQTL